MKTCQHNCNLIEYQAKISDTFYENLLFTSLLVATLDHHKHYANALNVMLCYMYIAYLVQYAEYLTKYEEKNFWP
jgi:hypothetical protein